MTDTPTLEEWLEQWEAANKVKRGLLVWKDQKLWLASLKFEEPKPIQKGLFDEC